MKIIKLKEVKENWKTHSGISVVVKDTQLSQVQRNEMNEQCDTDL